MGPSLKGRVPLLACCLLAEFHGLLVDVHPIGGCNVPSIAHSSSAGCLAMLAIVNLQQYAHRAKRRFRGCHGSLHCSSPFRGVPCALVTRAPSCAAKGSQDRPLLLPRGFISSQEPWTLPNEASRIFKYYIHLREIPYCSAVEDRPDKGPPECVLGSRNATC